MALTVTQKASVVQKHAPHTSMMDSNHVSDLDYDMLVTHVENTINRDKQNQHVGFTPQELMLRSNPGLFSCEIVPSGDMTNPRDMYNILSNKTKSIEDLEAKFKKELVKSVQSSGSFPKLSRALSMGDLDHKQGRGFKSLENHQRRINMFVLNKHNTSLVEGLDRVEEADVEIVKAVNLPNIDGQTASKGFTQKTKETSKTDIDELPSLTHTIGNGNKNIDAHQAQIGDKKVEVYVTEKPQVSFSDTKLEKWFSEMPSEVFDKAQRALMEESVQERLQEFKRKRSRKANFPHPSFNICIGAKHQKVPNTYLELRVDSFGRHLQTEIDDKRNRNRLYQKSMHNLKMRESAELDAHERIHRDNTFPRLTPNKSKKPSAFAKQKNKPDFNLSAARKPQRGIVKVQSDGGIKTLYINDNFDKDIGLKFCQKHGINNYDDYTEKLFAMKEMQYHDLLKTIIHSPPGLLIDQGDIDLERENTKASIVNIELKKDTPKFRTPFHMEKPLKEAGKTNDTLQNRFETSEAVIKQSDENTETSKPRELTHDKIITKIPTAISTRTSESRSSTSSLTSKEAMKKFNKLEVFAESQRQGKGNAPGNVTESDLRHLGHSYTSAFPSASRLDTRNQQRNVQQEIEEENEIRPKEVRKPDPEVVFRFEPGEVFVSRKNPNKTLTQSVASERARVIYGKVINSPMGKNVNAKKQVNKKEFMKDNSSFYRSEVRKYENRALDDCLTDMSSRPDNETKPMLIITSTGGTHAQKSTLESKSNAVSSKRDVATETDILGSPNASQLNTNFLRAPPSDRSGSGLTDFIIDDNDGESLESESDERDLTRHSADV